MFTAGVRIIDDAYLVYFTFMYERLRSIFRKTWAKNERDPLSSYFLPFHCDPTYEL